KVWSWLVFFYIFAWIIFSILGYLCKIVPFLWWTHKYSNQMGKPNVPTLAQMVPDKKIFMIYILFLVSLTGIVLGAILSSYIILFSFQIILLGTSCLYVYRILRIFYI